MPEDDPRFYEETARMFFNALEGLRVDLCIALDLDYLTASDQDVLDEILRLKKEVSSMVSCKS